jgi:hypothetical protein
MIGAWQRHEEEEPLRRSTRIANEGLGRSAARVVAVEECRMVRDAATRRAAFGDHECPDNPPNAPASPCRDAWSEAQWHRRQLGVAIAGRDWHVAPSALPPGVDAGVESA